MSGPHDRDRDGFDDGSGWQEPDHLGKDGPPPEPREARPRSGVGGLFSARRSGRPAPPPTDVQQVFAYQGDSTGAQGWAVQHGWSISDGTAPEDAELGELIAAAPTRLTRDHRAAGVLRGRYGSLDLVAFDVVYADTRRLVPEYAVTAAPVLIAAPGLRLSPARFWKHRTGGLVPIPGGNEEFDSRWVLLATADGPEVRRLAGDPAVQGLLLASDDGDEFWTSTVGPRAAGYVSVIRPDGHRPELIEHHARLLAAVVGALAGSG